MSGEISRRRFLTTSASAVAAGMIDGVAADGTALCKSQFAAEKGPLGKYVNALPPGRYDAHTHVYPGNPDPERIVKSFADAGLAANAFDTSSDILRSAQITTPMGAVL